MRDIEPTAVAVGPEASMLSTVLGHPQSVKYFNRLNWLIAIQLPQTEEIRGFFIRLAFNGLSERWLGLIDAHFSEGLKSFDGKTCRAWNINFLYSRLLSIVRLYFCAQNCHFSDFCFFRRRKKCVRCLDKKLEVGGFQIISFGSLRWRHSHWLKTFQS